MFLKKLSFFNRFLNLNEGEFSRVLLFWFVRFLYRFGFVIGWTIITAMFVTRFGISSLPYLFVFNALFIMGGSFLYLTLLKRFRRSNLIISTIFIAGFLLVAAGFLANYDVILFLLLVLAESLFLVQLSILFEDLIENSFSSLESERTFPVIESADTSGGIVAGLLVLSLASNLPTIKFVYIWLGSLFLIVPIILRLRSFQLDFSLGKTRQKFNSMDLFDRLNKAFRYVSKMRFLRALSIIIFLHWIFINILEFQYTLAVYENVSAAAGSEGAGFEHALVHDLGSLNVLFFGSALFVQLFLGSRLISNFGVVTTMLMYPVVMVLSVFGLLLNFNFMMAVLAKNNFVVSNVLFKNSYLSSYYAVNEDVRSYVRELFEGFVRPVGAVLGTGVLLIVQSIVLQGKVSMVLNFVMLILLGAMLLLFLRLQRGYTSIAVHDLETGDEDSKFNAVDVLTQKGHKESAEVLKSYLFSPDCSKLLRLKILKYFDNFDGSSLCGDLLRVALHPDVSSELKDSVLKYKFDECRYNTEHPFVRYEFVKKLKVTFRKSSVSSDLKVLIVKVLAKLDGANTMEFLLDVLDRGRKTKVLIACIQALKHFNDPGLVPYLRKFLTYKNYELRARAAIITWSFEGHRNDEVRRIIYSLLNSTQKRDRVAILKSIVRQDVGLKTFRPDLLVLLNSKCSETRLFAAIGLAKVGDELCIDVILELLFENSARFGATIREYFQYFSSDLKPVLIRAVHREASKRFSSFLKKNSVRRNQLFSESASELHELLSLLESEHEMSNISVLLEETRRKRYNLENN